MSRGPGAIQRRLVDILTETEGMLDTFELAARVYHPNEQGHVVLSEAQLVAVRRALGKLAAQGKVGRIKHGFRDAPGRRHWASATVAQQYHQRVEAVFGRS